MSVCPVYDWRYLMNDYPLDEEEVVVCLKKQ